MPGRAVTTASPSGRSAVRRLDDEGVGGVDLVGRHQPAGLETERAGDAGAVLEHGVAVVAGAGPMLRLA